MAATTTRIVPPRLSALPSGVLAGRRPHLFKTVEGTNFRSKDVHDHVAGVDQHPVALPNTLDTDARTSCLLNVLDQVFGDGADVALRPAAGHDHIIAYRGFTGEIDNDAVLGFHVFKTGEDGAERLLGTWAPGDDIGLMTRRPRECRCIQGFRSFPWVALTPIRPGVSRKISSSFASFQPAACGPLLVTCVLSFCFHACSYRWLSTVSICGDGPQALKFLLGCARRAERSTKAAT